MLGNPNPNNSLVAITNSYKARNSQEADDVGHQNNCAAPELETHSYRQELSYRSTPAIFEVKGRSLCTIESWQLLMKSLTMGVFTVESQKNFCVDIVVKSLCPLIGCCTIP